MTFTFTRDSVLWTIGMIGGIATMMAGHFDWFPWMSVQTQHWVEFVGTAAALISGKLATSPLSVSPTGRVAEQQANVKALEQAATDFVATTPKPATVVVQVDPEKQEPKP